ncbi:MAG TPA: XRE family transcriptional regulator [Lachnoclostridium phytofermentans]|uniref:XRE family transcriptional regulator n=1 Tax=Lachnoclostridium phytofermentans TaxID=66219 RepID=A0A3D2X9T0_9FIRM|nr:helix-turn-helix transcriptional regulator [Lachnoclostridium sp.]HCL03900.1 XRE family transcriptional regulator [Lachnoclostridium phytofermentans]
MDSIYKFCANEIPNVNLTKTGKKLKELRISANFTVEQLQRVFGFNNPTTIYKWEAGRCLPDINNMFVLKELYKVSLESIYVLDNEPEMLFLSVIYLIHVRIKL